MNDYITNGHLKIKNPQLQENATYNNVCAVEDFDFANEVKHQLGNYNKIQELLNSQGIFFTEINIVKWNSQKNGCKSASRRKFIIKTSNPDLMWYKYDAEIAGGGNNLIYYKKRKIKTSFFTGYTVDNIGEFFAFNFIFFVI